MMGYIRYRTENFGLKKSFRNRKKKSIHRIKTSSDIEKKNIHTICTHASYRPGWCFHHQTSLKSLGVINLLVCIGGAKSKIAHQFSARFQFGVWVCLKMGYRY